MGTHLQTKKGKKVFLGGRRDKQTKKRRGKKEREMKNHIKTLREGASSVNISKVQEERNRDQN